MSLAEPGDINMLPKPSEVGASPGPVTGLGENIASAYESQSKLYSQYGLTEMWTEELQKRDDQIFELTGKRPGVFYTAPEFNEIYRANPNPDPQAFGAEVSPFLRRDANAKKAENEIMALRQQYPEIKTRDDIMKSISEKRAQIEASAADVSSRAGIPGMVGGFLGGMAGSMTTNSPTNLATLPVGGFGATVTKRLATEFVTQAAIAGVEQIFVGQDFTRMGETLTTEQQAGNVLLAGSAGVAFRGVFEGAGALYSALKARGAEKDPVGLVAKDLTEAKTPEERAAILKQADPEVVAEINDLVNPVQSTAQRGAAQAAEVEAFTEKENPFTADLAKKHGEMLAKTEAAIESGDALPATEQNMAKINDIYKNVGIESFRAEDLTIDAPAMQFKSGGDSQGVTDRLQGTKEWSDYLAGVITVWKKKDGTVVVADGHQRVGLAKKMIAQDPTKKISLKASVFEEAAGDTEEFVRAIAGLKNISEGTGSPLDASRVFKNLPERAESLFKSLPSTSQLVRQGMDLASLDNEAYKMVENGVIDQRIAAVVGRMEKDHNQQRALMALLAKEEPATVFQAEQIVKQAQMAGFDTAEQTTLFGSESFTESLFKDKAKILERTSKIVKNNIKTFKNLVTNADQITAAGNVINNSSNSAILSDSTTLLGLIENLAYRKGTVSSLLTQYAREAKENGRYKQSAEQFVEAIRSRINDGGISSLIDGAEGDLSTALAEVNRSIESENIVKNVETTKELFDEQPKTIDKSFQELKDVRDMYEGILPSQRQAYGQAVIEGKSRPLTIDSPDFDSPQRVSLRKKIVDTLYGNGALRKDRIIEIIMGPPGSGKSSVVAKDLVTKLGAIEVDADAAKELFPEYDGGIGAHAVHDESKLVVKGEGSVLERAVENGDNIVYPIVGSDLEKMNKLIDEFKESGYTVNIRLVEVSPETSLSRVEARYAETGRAIPPEVVLGYGNKPTEVFDTLVKNRKDITYYAKFNNEVAFGQPAKVEASNDASFPRSGAGDGQNIEGEARGLRDGNLNSPQGERAASKTSGSPEEPVRTEGMSKKDWQKAQEKYLQEKQLAEFNPDDEIPVSIEFDEAGNEVMKTQKLGELMREIESHESLFENMTKCLL